MSSSTNAKPSKATKSTSLSKDNDEDLLQSHFVETHNIITSTMNDIPGYRVVKVLGAIYGITVRTRNIGVGLVAVAKSVVGGEISQFTELMYRCRGKAVERLCGEVGSRLLVLLCL
jgi:hypothetical protein